MNPLHLVMIAALAILFPSVSGGAGLPVSYIVDEKALKGAISGTDLSFQLFEADTCVSPVHTAVLEIDDIFATKLKRFGASGGSKPPKAVELRATLAGVEARGNLYLQVVGTGVVALGGACQAQAAQVAYPPTCFDGVRNQGETDVDCGGQYCSGCQAGQTCAVGSDCLGGDCTSGACVANCSDSQKNQDETGTDCGGSICAARCAYDGGCLSASDCAPSVPNQIYCVDSFCVTTTSTTTTSVSTTTMP